MAKGRFLSGDEIEITHEVRSCKGCGTVKAKLYFDEPDRSCGYWGGWIVDAVVLDNVEMDAQEFERRFGYGALCDLQDSAARDAYHLYVEAPADRREEY